MAATVGVIDLSQQRLRLLLAERGKSAPPLIREEMPLPEGLEGLPQALAKLREAELLTADRWLVSLSSDLFSMHELHLPVPDLRKAKLALDFELEAELPFKRDEVVVATRLRKSEGGTAVVALVAPIAELSAIVTALQEEGIEPTTIVPSCLGLAHPDVRSGPTIVMDVGATSTEALALANDEPLAMVTIDEGGDTVNRALANSHYLDEVEAERVKREEGSSSEGQAALEPATRQLARHLSRGLRSLQRKLGWRECTVILGGGGACTPALAERLAEEIGQPVDLANTTDSLVGDPVQALAWAPELGLLRSLRAGTLWQPLNLRADSLAYQGDFRRALKAVSGLGTWAAVILLLLCAQVFADIDVRYNQAERYDEARQQACAQIAGIADSTPIQCLAAMEEAIGGTGKDDIPRYDALDVFAGISAAVPAALDVKIDVTRIDGKNLRLEGSTTGFHQASQLNEALSKAPCVNELRSDKTVKQGNKVRFTFSGKVDCSQRPPDPDLLAQKPKRSARKKNVQNKSSRLPMKKKDSTPIKAKKTFKPPRKSDLPSGLAAPKDSSSTDEDDSSDSDESDFKPPPKLNINLPTSSPMKLHLPQIEKGISGTYGGRKPENEDASDDGEETDE